MRKGPDLPKGSSPQEPPSANDGGVWEGKHCSFLPSGGTPLKHVHHRLPELCSGIKLLLSSVVTCFVKELVRAPSLPCLTLSFHYKCILGWLPEQTKGHRLASGEPNLKCLWILKHF